MQRLRWRIGSLLAWWAFAAASLLGQQDAWPPDPTHWQALLERLTPAGQQSLLGYLDLKADSAAAQPTLMNAWTRLGTERRDRAWQFAEYLAAPSSLWQGVVRTQWDADTAYLGTVEEGDIQIFQFKVTNLGPDPYVIRKVETACQCSAIVWPETPLAPGASGIVRIEYSAKQKAGRIVTGVILHDNSWPDGRKILYVAGWIQPLHPLAPPKQ